MTTDQRARVDAAHAIAEELSRIIGIEGPSATVWQQRLQQIAHNLSVPDATDDQRLAAAREGFDSLYAGGRNFTDFHLWRTHEAERIAVNERLSQLVARLKELLHSG